MNTLVRSQHAWLQRMVGEWTCVVEVVLKPGDPPGQDISTESVRSLDCVWIIAEATGENAGAKVYSMMTLGYDPARSLFVGSFISSMMTHLWLYEGELDEGGEKLMLRSEGPSIEDEGSIAKYLDTIEFKGDDHRVLRSSYLTKAGAWQAFMTADYRRVS